MRTKRSRAELNAMNGEPWNVTGNNGLMRVFQHSVSQRKRFYATKKRCVLFTQPQTPQRHLRLLAPLRK